MKKCEVNNTVTRKFVAEGDRLRVRYKGRTVEGSLTEGKEYDAAYITLEMETGETERMEEFIVRDDSGYGCSYSNDLFEIIQ